VADNIQAADSHFSGIATDGVRQAGKQEVFRSIRDFYRPQRSINRHGGSSVYGGLSPRPGGVYGAAARPIQSAGAVDVNAGQEGRPQGVCGRSTNGADRTVPGLRAVSSIHFPVWAMLLAIVRPDQRFAWPIRPGRYVCRTPRERGSATACQRQGGSHGDASGH
jgi:hypothetical protein